MKVWLNFNGTLIEEKTPVISADNRGFRYGDGLFETMRVSGENIKLKDMHFRRLFAGMWLMQIGLPSHVTAKVLEHEILKTIAINNQTGQVRVRLTVFRGDGNLFEFHESGGGYIIQTWELSSFNHVLNENGLVLGVYDAARKATDHFSNLKSNNYLVYIMGALYAKQNQFNDCLVLNVHNRVCDSTIANVFWVKEGDIYTPPLTEGCIAGVMRGHLMVELLKMGYNVYEKETDVQELRKADEIFLTNAIAGLRWVKEFMGKTYGNEMSKLIFNATI
jgi:branched-chain amino acid aminotransferase